MTKPRWPIDADALKRARLLAERQKQRRQAKRDYLADWVRNAAESFAKRVNKPN